MGIFCRLFRWFELRFFHVYPRRLHCNVLDSKARHPGAVRSTNLNKESAMAKRLVFIVMTDFCCWMPIIIISILSLTGNFEDPDKIAYVWIAVFVLPLNSSLNPILYTFSTERAKRSLTRRRKNVTDFVMKTINGRVAGRLNQTFTKLKKFKPS